MTKNILFPIYHLRDFNFFKKIAEEISDYKFYFLFFFDHDLKSLSKKKNIVIFFDIKETVIEDKKIEDEKLMHEHLTFETSLEDLRNKYKKYFSKSKKILKELNIDLVFQELGGFVCHLAIFNACKESKVNHYFIEPSPLKKNSFFLKNSMEQEDAIRINDLKQTKIKCHEYLKSISNEKYLAINNKDKHLNKKNMFYQIFAISTFKAFVKKIIFIIFLKRNEFKNLRNHIKDYFKRAIYSFLNLFTKVLDINELNNFIYYPLHVPLDFALTHRAYSKIDQIKNLKEIIPNCNFQLALKEHPLIYSRYHYKSIIKKLGNTKTVFLKKNLSSLEISSRAICAITINSKSGLEFLCKDKPVFSLVKNYYTKTGLATLITSKSEFDHCLKNINQLRPHKLTLLRLLFWIFEKASFFDLYNLEEKSFNNSLLTFRRLINERKL